jgi:nucleoid-associated protein YgaU
MTRETKIGLLVGLAFIIVIGILLSDHMSSTNEPTSAPLAGAGSNVREGVTSPAGEGQPVTVAAASQAADAPRAPVPTQADLNPPAPPTGYVQVGPGGAPAGPTRITQRTAPPTPQPDPEPTPDGDDRAANTGAGGGGAPAGPAIARGNEPPPSGEPLAPPSQPRKNARGTPRPGDPRELVLHHPEDFQTEGPDGNAQGNPPGANPVSSKPTVGQARGPSAPKSYTAEPGDSVSRIAARMYGANTKANRDLIIRANPPLQAEGNPVIVGKAYVIPNAPAVTVPGKPARQPANDGTAVATRDNPGTKGDGTEAKPNPRTNGRKPTPPPAAGPGEVWYTVKENDNLWKIAEAQLGTGNAWTQIRDLNKDVLKGGENVRPNMRIRLPARSSSPSVATASGN